MHHGLHAAFPIPHLHLQTTGDAAKGVAVAVGISYTEYYLNSAAYGMSAYTATSGTLSVVCGRLSFALGLKGPSVSIDTACSSSLVGAHLACSSFLTRDCPRALVAGINLTMRAETTAVLTKAGMLTQVGVLKLTHCTSLQSYAEKRHWLAQLGDGRAGPFWGRDHACTMHANIMLHNSSKSLLNFRSVAMFEP